MEAHWSLLVSHMTSIVSNIASLTAFEALMWKPCDLDLGRFKVIKVKDAGANRQHMSDLLFDFCWPQRHICHHFKNIWPVILMTWN